MVQQFVQLSVRGDLRASLRQNELAIARVHAQADQQNSRFLRIVGENAALKAGMQLLRSKHGSGAARMTVEDQLRELGEHMGFDFLLVSAPNGEPLAGVVRETGSDQNATGQLIPFNPSLIDHSGNGLLQLRSQTFQVASVPMDDDETNIGSLSVGERFEFPGFATPSVLIHDGKVIESNIPNASAADVQTALASCAGQVECDFQLKSVNWTSAPVRLFGGGFVLWGLENVDAVTGPILSRLRSLFLIMGFGSLLVALVCGVTSSRYIVKPIALLVSHLRNAEHTGVLPEFTIDFSSTPEIRALAESYNRAASAVHNARENLQGAYVEFVGSLANALDARDRYTAGHSSRVSQLSCATSAAMGLGIEDVERIRIGALLHDIGKIGIADSVLQKPGRLTNEEFALVKEHPAIGRRILEGVRGFAAYLDAVELHHENWDGTGYPKGQSHEETPLDARIIHVADAYDAMTTNRSYRRRMTHAEAIGELRRCAGTQFDPQVVSIFAELPREIVGNQDLSLQVNPDAAELEGVEA
jgi:HD-GYP domain-containing protein (c-di-GMP phosphodiesterase class II)